MSLGQMEMPNQPSPPTRMSQVDAQLEQMISLLSRLNDASQMLGKRLNKVCRSYIVPETKDEKGETPYVQLAEQLKGMNTSAYKTLQTLEVILETLEL